MLLQGTISSDKTQKLVEEYAKLLNSGVDSSKILVILQNSNKKHQFIEETLRRLTIDAIEKLQVYSFFGLVYNAISDNWVKIENQIPDEKNTKILPNLTGLEISQFIMREIISEIKFEGYNSKKSLLHQLFRRYSLIVQNNLSDEDVKWRSEEVLKESFAPDAKKALDEFKKKTLESRALDYLRQSLIFNYIYKKTNYFAKIEYLIVDDGDEITPICLDFIEYLKPQLKDVFIAYDSFGGSRQGYLSADKSVGAKLEELFARIPSPPEGEEIFQHETRVLEKSSGGQKSISHLYTKQALKYAKELRKNMTNAEYTLWYFLRDRQMNGIKFRKQSPICNYIVDFVSFEKKLVIELDGGQHCENDNIKHDKIRDDFLKNSGYTVLRFFNNEITQNIEGVLQVIYDYTAPHPNPPPQGGRENSATQSCPPSLYLPFTVHSSLFTISKRAQMLDVGIQKVKKLIENGIKPCEITIITPIIDDMLKICLKENFNVKNLLFLSGSEKITQNPIVHFALTTLKLCDSEMKKDLDSFDIRAILDFLQIPLRHCKQILETFENTQTLIPFEFKISEYTEKYEKFLTVLETLKNFEKLSEQVYEIYENLVEIENFTYTDITKFDFFIKQLEDFENVFGTELKKSQIINQIENSITSENPYSTLEIKTNNLIIATPQKIIDNQIQTKYQIWFDVSSDEWIKSDTGPLYNAWVFQAGWEKSEYTIHDNIELSQQKTVRILRKLTHCANEKIYAYASLFDGSGIENFGGIEKYLVQETETKNKLPQREFKPREDQKPVLDYQKGKMAISAVPGAGKTTILLALIIKLLNDNVKPENIFVLTYMESAARNFRERIQNSNQELSQLPNISTIHGLALKILKENANYEKLGLNFDFEICDDTQRSRILREIGTKLDIKKTELEDFDRAVSILKIGGGVEISGSDFGFASQNPSHDKKLTKFLEFFKEYKQILQSNNLIDYDDMLILSVKLLEENSDILQYYQELCHFIIEDEAQDSSAIQQKLIELLSGKHKNLIRCGDINQAITTTFSNADVEGFRKFIEQSETTVSMNQSQRCTKDVWTLANKLVISAKDKSETKNAFYQIFMKPVDGKNPNSPNAIKHIILENEFAEKNYILKQIKELLAKDPKATIGILLRSNYQVASWTKFINNAGMKTITRSECLEQKGIFRTIFAVLKIISNPFDNENLAENYDILAELGHCKSNLFQTIKNYPKPFIQECVDDIENLDLAEFYWQVIHWLSFSSLPAEEIAIKVGFLYYSSDIEKSNVYLISTLIKRLSNSYKKYSTLIERLGELSKKPNLSGFKFFSEEEKSEREILEGKVQIMTLHKSKGDEFDCVFLPEMTEGNLALDFKNVSLKKNARFMEGIRELNPNYPAKTDNELKEFLLAENLRLMYVAITRAKQKLYITSNKSAKYNKEPVQSVIFDMIEQCGGQV